MTPGSGQTLQSDNNAETRCGYVALIGRPNVGKSTLLNAFLGQKLSIVTSKAQTTWKRVTGIYTDDDVQMVFLDTPGLLEVKDLFQETMLGAAYQALDEADVVLLLVDATRPDKAKLEELVPRVSCPLVVGINKIDAASSETVKLLTDWTRERLGCPVYELSALKGRGVSELRQELQRSLPVGPFLYPPDQAASDSLRFFVAELVRETVFEHFRQEIPYSVICEVEEFREAQDPVYIQVNIFVERASQKGILIGEGGRSIRAVGKKARRKVEALIERSVYLELWVKPLVGWRKKKGHLKRFGFDVPGGKS